MSPFARALAFARRHALALGLVAYYCATRGIYQGKASGDGFFGFLYLPAIVFDHTVDIAKQAPQWIPYLGREPTGHVPNACPIGPVAFWLPTYLLGLALEEARALLVHATPPSGQSPFDFWMAGLGSLFAGLAGLALEFRLLKRRLPESAARLGTAMSALVTPLTWYLVTQPLYQHACAFFAVTLLVERWDAYRAERAWTPARFAVLGAIGGAAMTMRLQEVIWLLLPGLDLVSMITEAVSRKTDGARVDGGRLARALACGALLAIGALVAFSPQLLVWRYFFGHLRPPQPPGHMRWLDPAIVATIFSTRGGLLPWSPALYLVAPGLWLGRRRLAGLAGPLALVLALDLWVNAAAWDHWGSWTFGARRFTDATVAYGAAFAALFAAALDRRAGPSAGSRRFARSALSVAFALLPLYNGLLMELCRQQRIKSSGAGAFPFATWATWAGAPRWLAHAFDRVGYPFVQPAGWIHALAYRVSPSAFEGIVGNYFLDRDSRVHAVVHTPSLSFADPGSFVPEGIVGKADAGGAVPVAERVRILVPLFAREPIRLTLRGTFVDPGRVSATWNGAPLVPHPARAGATAFDVPAAIEHTRSRENELVLSLPPKTRLTRLDFESLGDYWR